MAATHVKAVWSPDSWAVEELWQPLAEHTLSEALVLGDVECMRTEARLWQCLHSGCFAHNCDHHEDAGVICSDGLSSEPASLSGPAPSFPVSDMISGQLMIRLVDGKNGVKEERKFFTMAHGMLFVMTFGKSRMPMWYAGSWPVRKVPALLRTATLRGRGEHLPG